MTFLPIVERELRVAARRSATYWGRMLTALIALGVGMFVFLEASDSPPQDLGSWLFMVLASAAFLHCVLAGVRQTADSLSAERREGTLGLLFLTDLHGYDVVLGKLAASSLYSLYGLLAIFPVLGLSLLFGGVSAMQFLKVLLVLLNTLLFSLAVGLFASLWFHNGRKAAGLAFLALLSATVGPWGYGGFWSATHHGAPPPTWVFLASPAFPLVLALAPLARGAPVILFWPSLALVGAAGVGALTLTSLLLPRIWRDRPAPAWRLRWQARWRCWRGMNATFRRRLLAINPFFWLVARDRGKPYYVWGFLLTAAVGTFFFVRWQSDLSLVSDVLPTVSVLVHGVLKVWIAGVVISRLSEDRRSGALELLLSTPLRADEIFRGQRRALYRQFGAAMAAVLMVDAVAAFMETDGTTRWVWGAHMVLLPADALAIAWVGTWMAMTAKHSNQATLHTLARTLLLPWSVFLGLVTLYMTFDLERRWRWDVSNEAVVMIWFFLGLANDLVFAGWAWYRLKSEFRRAAAGGFTGERRGWRTVWLRREKAA